MSLHYRPKTPEDWMRHLFSAKAAKDGGVVRRSVRDMERFLAEMQRRGFTVAENAGQVIVFCNAEPVRITSRRTAKDL